MADAARGPALTPGYGEQERRTEGGEVLVELADVGGVAEADSLADGADLDDTREHVV